MSEPKKKYTQREWDREVGWGEVPPEYAYDSTEQQDEEPTPELWDEAYKKSMDGV